MSNEDLKAQEAEVAEALFGDGPEQPWGEPEPKPEEPVEAAPEEPVEEPKKEPEEKSEPEAAAADAPSRQVPLEALQEERRKRQELAERLARLEGRADAMAKPEAPAGKADPLKVEQDYYHDPKSYVDAAVAKAYNAAYEKATQESLQARVAASIEQARAKYDDFDDVDAVFGNLVRDNPGLYQKAYAQFDPAGWMYNYVKQHQAVADISDPDAWREAERAKIRAELESEFKKGAASSAASQLPPTQAGARSVGETSALGSMDDADALLEAAGIAAY